ncbi:hypothetical protein HOD61_01640 [archaeon]|jgi:hypothetical protein|nr:hypothetical protein [archaeon]
MSKITAVKKSDIRSVFIVEKKNSFYKLMLKVISNYDFDYVSDIFPVYEGEGSGADLTKENDFFLEFSNNLITLELSFGQKRIFIIARGKKRVIEKFNDLMFKHFEFKK